MTIWVPLAKCPLRQKFPRKNSFDPRSIFLSNSSLLSSHPRRGTGGVGAISVQGGGVVPHLESYLLVYDFSGDFLTHVARLPSRVFLRLGLRRPLVSGDWVVTIPVVDTHPKPHSFFLSFLFALSLSSPGPTPLGAKHLWTRTHFQTTPATLPDHPPSPHQTGPKRYRVRVTDTRWT